MTHNKNRQELNMLLAKRKDYVRYLLSELKTAEQGIERLSGLISNEHITKLTTQGE